ncbi:MAG: RsmD family RNA methyltransferase [Acidimicrobiales bacterium]
MVAADHDVVSFGGLRVAVADGVLAPRPWTLLQSEWAAELSPGCGPGPIVELFAGAGHIGLEAARRTGRSAVVVDADVDACVLARATAHHNHLGEHVEVRCTPVAEAFEPHDDPALLLADPPYVPSREVDRFDDDPDHAIDGGRDGLRFVRAAIVACHPHLAVGVPLLVQVRGLAQAADVGRWFERHPDLDLEVTEVRAAGTDRAVALVRHRSAEHGSADGHRRRSAVDQPSIS